MAIEHPVDPETGRWEILRTQPIVLEGYLTYLDDCACGLQLFDLREKARTPYYPGTGIPISHLNPRVASAEDFLSLISRYYDQRVRILVEPIKEGRDERRLGRDKGMEGRGRGRGWGLPPG